MHLILYSKENNCINSNKMIMRDKRRLFDSEQVFGYRKRLSGIGKEMPEIKQVRSGRHGSLDTGAICGQHQGKLRERIRHYKEVQISLGKGEG